MLNIFGHKTESITVNYISNVRLNGEHLVWLHQFKTDIFLCFSWKSSSSLLLFVIFPFLHSLDIDAIEKRKFTSYKPTITNFSTKFDQYWTMNGRQNCAIMFIFRCVIHNKAIWLGFCGWLSYYYFCLCLIILQQEPLNSTNVQF